jgi:hypothetical protein
MSGCSNRKTDLAVWNDVYRLYHWGWVLKRLQNPAKVLGDFPVRMIAIRALAAEGLHAAAIAKRVRRAER